MKNNKSDHTPGPWTYTLGASCQVAAIHKTGGNYIGRVDAAPKRPEKENTANARLIAAAPQMLEALQGLVSDYEERGLTAMAWDKIEDYHAARAAITMATGKGSA